MQHTKRSHSTYDSGTHGTTDSMATNLRLPSPHLEPQSPMGAARATRRPQCVSRTDSYDICHRNHTAPQQATTHLPGAIAKLTSVRKLHPRTQTGQDRHRVAQEPPNPEPIGQAQRHLNRRPLHLCHHSLKLSNFPLIGGMAQAPRSNDARLKCKQRLGNCDHGMAPGGGKLF
eukprot:6662778-Pyramimonas_sp.AAC.3